MTDRAVSSTLEYVFGIAIATILLGVLISGAAGLVESHQETAIRTEFDVLGQRLASDMASADRLAKTGGTTVELETTLPERVAGSDYDIQVNATASDSELVLRSDEPEITITVGFVNTTDVEPTEIDGGDVRIVLAGDGDLEVREA